MERRRLLEAVKPVVMIKICYRFILVNSQPMDVLEMFVFLVSHIDIAGLWFPHHCPQVCLIIVQQPGRAINLVNADNGHVCQRQSASSR